MMGCTIEEDVKIRMVNDSIPPTFKLSGTGSRPYFFVHGPYEVDEKAGSMKPPIWAINAAGTELHFEVLSRLPPIKYGDVPSGLRQEIPKDGNSPDLIEGKSYGVEVYAMGPGLAASMCIVIKQGKAIPCP